MTTSTLTLAFHVDFAACHSLSAVGFHPVHVSRKAPLTKTRNSSFAGLYDNLLNDTCIKAFFIVSTAKIVSSKEVAREGESRTKLKIVCHFFLKKESVAVFVLLS